MSNRDSWRGVAKIIALLGTLALVTSCDRNMYEGRNNGEATKQQLNAEGTELVVNDPNGGASGSELQTQVREIDAQFPPPEPPSKTDNLYAVEAVSDDGSLVLEDGRTIHILGLKCSPQGADSLRSFIFAEANPRVALRAIEDAAHDNEANVWVAHSSEFQQNEVAGYSRVGDAALLNGWCAPDSENASRYVSRNVALARLGNRMRTSAPR